jgi:1-acyl-sn-glycerol-3-phosphate acyltransferase
MATSPPRTAAAPGSSFFLPLRVFYALYVWAVFLVLALGSLPAVLVLPSLEGRRRIVRWVARTFLRLAGMPFEVRFAERLPAGQCVVVANHASYLDGVVFKAALPPRFGFVIKREMASVPLAGLLLRRIGSEFVERFNPQRGASDARRMLRNASNGHSLMFFPEGTFTHQPGLARFHTGAFVTAARAGCPVVPIVVRGTRRALAPGTLLPLPAHIQLEVLPPLVPLARANDDTQPRAAAIRDQARSAILERLGEPDLAIPVAAGAP